MKWYRFHGALLIAREFPDQPGHRGYPRIRHIKRILRRTSHGIGTLRGYDPGNRLHGDRRRVARVRLEAPVRRQLGIGRYDPWPQGDPLVFLVASEPEDAIDAALCRECLDQFPDDTVLAVEDASEEDGGEEQYCDHCGRQIGGDDA